MFKTKNQNKLENNLYNAASEDFMPVACHYDRNTLLTKNGQLLQIIQINGINSEKISKKLFNLRKMVRQAIRENDNLENFAFWIHTIRRKANLDDDATYNGFLSANAHDLWRKKNYWHDKFVNNLYITIIHDSPNLKVTNLGSMLNSLSTNTITNFAENFLKSASNKLTKLTDNILESLNEFGATKLGIKFVDDQCFSEPMFLYRRIIQLNENECLLPITDISKALASHNYAVGSDKIEVIGDGQKRFAAILSIKEYQEVASDPIDLFLQIPVEMITTEVFYFVNRKEIAPIFKDQDYILKVSKNDELREFKELDKILDDKEEIKNKFCQQQISVMVIADDVEHLDQQTIKASQKLASIGIVHVREDINLEKTFWAQLPANFSYLSRMQPTIIDNVAALASLHNSPTGNQYNPWGKAITLLRTEKGTPYFMNFHDSNGETNNCIIGTKKSGKTTLLNFLISEADKFNPSIFYVSDDLSSGLFIKAKGGKWLQDSKQIINPLLIQNSDKAQGFLVEFFKIIGNHYIKPINETGLTELTNLASDVLKLEPDKRKLSQIIPNIQDPDLKKRFTVYDKDQKYYQIFESDTNFNLEDGSITGVSLQEFNDAAFTKKHYPREKKLLAQKLIKSSRKPIFSQASRLIPLIIFSWIASKPKLSQ